MKRVLITGAGGFVGPYLIQELQRTGEFDIYGSVFSPTSDLQGLLSSDHILPGDLTNYSYTVSAIQTSQPEIVYNLASIAKVESTVKDTTKLITTNTLLAYNVLEAVRVHSPSARVIAISSGNAYGAVAKAETPIKETNPLRPLNAYAVSKISQEYLCLQYHHAYNLDVVVLRPFNHTGPGQTSDFVVPALAKQFVDIMSNSAPPAIKVGSLDSARDFTDVRDMVRAYPLAAEYGINGEAYNIGSGQARSIGEIVEMLQTVSGIKVQVESEPAKVRAADVPLLVADFTKFRTLTNWQPQINLQQTLKDVLEYWKGKND